MSEWMFHLDGTEDKGVWCYLRNEPDEIPVYGKVIGYQYFEFDAKPFIEDRFWLEYDKVWFDFAEPIEDNELIKLLESDRANKAK